MKSIECWKTSSWIPDRALWYLIPDDQQDLIPSCLARGMNDPYMPLAWEERSSADALRHAKIY